MTEDAIEVLAEIHRAWIVGLFAFGQARHVGPFVLTSDPNNDMIWVNYAVPASADVSIDALRTALPELFDAFAVINRRQRFEFLEDLFPDLAPMLESGGLSLQARFPVMICTASDLTSRETDPRIVVNQLTADASDEMLLEIVRMRLRGFGEAIPDSSELQRLANELREQLRTGKLRTVFATFDGTIAGSASLLAGESTRELVGVVTDEAFRGRGNARACSEFLARDFIQAGGRAVWLSAGNDLARRVYERCGFRAVGHQLNYFAK